MNKCPQCGAEVGSQSTCCGICGASLDQEYVYTTTFPTTPQPDKVQEPTIQFDKLTLNELKKSENDKIEESIEQLKEEMAAKETAENNSSKEIFDYDKELENEDNIISENNAQVEKSKDNSSDIDEDNLNELLADIKASINADNSHNDTAQDNSEENNQCDEEIEGTSDDNTADSTEEVVTDSNNTDAPIAADEKISPAPAADTDSDSTQDSTEDNNDLPTEEETNETEDTSPESNENTEDYTENSTDAPVDDSPVEDNSDTEIYDDDNEDSEENDSEFTFIDWAYEFFSPIKKALFNTEDHTSEFDEADIKENSNFSLLGYLEFLFFIPMIVKPKSDYIRFHGNQGLTLFLTSVGLEIVNIILNTIFGAVCTSNGSVTGLGIALIAIVTVLINACILLLVAVGIANAVKGKARTLPIIGKFTLLK